MCFWRSCRTAKRKSGKPEGVFLMLERCRQNRHLLSQLLCLAGILVFASCAVGRHEQTNNPSSTGSAEGSKQAKVETVRLQKASQTGDAITIALENDTDAPIFVSYRKSDNSTFLTYLLERKSADGTFQLADSGI